MTETLILLIALLVLPVVLLFSFAGCTGQDAILRQRLEEEKAAAAQKIKDIENQMAADAAQREAAAVASKFFNVVSETPNLVSYWRLDEVGTGGTTAKDSVPAKNNPPHDGRYVNLQGISFGQKGALEPLKHPDDKSAEFLGTQGYVEVDYDALRNPPQSFSVEVWLRPQGSATTAQVVIGSYELDLMGRVLRGFVLDVLRDTVPPRVRARVGNGTGFTAIEASLGDGLINDGWRHVLMTYSAPAKALLLYVDAADGKPDAQQPSATNPAPVEYSAIPLGSTMPLRIAAGQPEQLRAGGNLDFFFDGRIDEVALYRDVLAGTTIREHYLSSLGVPV